MVEQGLGALDEHIHCQFQGYHLANYHDGDDTFASSIFGTDEHGDYSNEFVRDCFEHFYHSFTYLVNIGGEELRSQLTVEN